MNALAIEYYDVFQLYLRLGKELTKIMDMADPQNPRAFAESILESQDYLARIEQVNSRILQLFEDWEASRATIDPQMKEEVCELAWAAKTQAVQLKKLCGIYAQRLQEVM
jgi:hypothetical protein